ncbi:MAG: hypothetical protein KJ703_07900, partial [Alphaproteobacteria bacterium]|nr:hypothetical protein [Alphaproteobacteria bacterium]
QADTAEDESGRGILFTLWNKFTLKQGLIRESDSLGGHLLFEMVKPGSYYTSEDTALWFRWELMYTF